MDTARLERLMRHVKKQDNGCWEWQAFINPGGYGVASDGVRPRAAHRVVYEVIKGPIPHGLTLDHLCRNTRCVNPEHLEPVTTRENTLRSNGVTAINARKTHCKHGHPLDEENTYKTKRNQRYCKRCMRIAQRRWSAKKKGQTVSEADFLDADGAPRKRTPRTQCPHGHPYTPENSYYRRGYRECLTCRRKATREWEKKRVRKPRSSRQ